MATHVAMPEGFVLDPPKNPLPEGFVLDNPGITIAPGSEEALAAAQGGTILDRVKAKVNQKSLGPLSDLATQSGLLKGYIDPAEGILQIVDKMSPRRTYLEEQGISVPSVSEGIEKREEAYQARRVAEGEEGFDWARMVGNIVNPTTAIGGAAKIPATFGKKALQSSAMMAGYGGIQPVTEGDFALDKTIQVGLGATIGAVLPGLIVGGKWTGNKIADVFRSKDTKAFNELAKDLSELLGETLPKTIKALESYKPRITKPTSTQAISQATRAARAAGTPDEFGGTVAKLTKDVSRQFDVGDQLKTTAAKQEVGRESFLKWIMGSEDDMTRDVLQRKTIADPLFDAARKSKKKVNVKNVVTALNKLIKVNENNDKISIPLRKIRNKIVTSKKVVLKEGIKIKRGERYPVQHIEKTKTVTTIESSPEKLISLSDGIKVMLKKTSDNKPTYDAKVLTEIKNLLDNNIKNVVPEYRKAVEGYAKASTQIDRRKLAKVLFKALQNPKEEETAAIYLRAMREMPQTIKKATGFGKTTKMENIFTPEQARGAKLIYQELLDKQKSMKMASDTSSVLSTMMEKDAIRAPRILKREIVILNHILSRMQTGKAPEYQRVLGEMLDDPDVLLKALKSAGTLKYKIAKEAMTKLVTITSAQQIGAATQSLQRE